MFDFEKHSVCLADGPAAAFVLIAIRPERSQRPGSPVTTMIWDDGDHQRAFQVETVLEDTSQRFRFRDSRGRVLSLQPMTADLYSSRVRSETHGPELGSDSAVRAFFLQPRGW